LSIGNKAALQKLVVTILLAILLVGVSYQATSTVKEKWQKSINRDIYDAFSLFDEHLRSHPRNCRYLSDVDVASYYWDRPRLMLMASQNRPIFTALDPNEIDWILNSKNICAVLINDYYVMGFLPPESPLARYLHGEQFISDRVRTRVGTLFVRREARA